MAPKLTRRPSRAAVARSLRELEILWRPPDKKETADPERKSESTAEESKAAAKSTRKALRFQSLCAVASWLAVFFRWAQ